MNEPASVSEPRTQPGAAPGGEGRRLVVPAAIVGGALVSCALWWLLAPHGPKAPFLVFENPTLGCQFEYPSELTAGPNFVRGETGAILTIERHSLAMAKKDWVADLPDVLFPQVRIQLAESYNDLVETSRGEVTVDGRKGLEVVLAGHTGTDGPPTVITIVIFANEDWVYVLRTYSRETLDAKERPLFRHVRETWKFLDDGPGAEAS